MAHSLSPVLHAAGLASLGLLGGYTAYEASDAAALAVIVGRLRAGELHGLNVTLPWKVEVTDLVDRLEGEALALGAVNTLVRAEGGQLVGHNTDVWGLEAAVRAALPLGQPPPREGITVIGAGGAARAALQVAARLGAREVRVWNRTPLRAEAMVDAMARRGLAAVEGPRLSEGLVGAAATPHRVRSPTTAPSDEAAAVRAAPLRVSVCTTLPEALEGAQLVLQASAWGLTAPRDHASVDLPAMISRTHPHALVVDLVYAPWGTPSRATPWVEAASLAGRPAVDGLAMLVHQAARAFWLWTGQRPDLAALWRSVGGEPGVSRSAG